ncbi:hypothetical protein Syun_031971 [Stephania yunnanensis]|uniref:Uncharacterized protein n=1 Tax=Stephania yunnanensis TaxID=152371 RepID=A0AAP0DWL7_9MAGN
MDRIQMMESSPLHPLLVRMLLPLERRNELRLDSEWTHSVGLGSYLVPLMVEMDDFGSTLSSFYTRRWSFPIRDRTRAYHVKGGSKPPLELPFVGLEIARGHHLLDSFLRCSREREAELARYLPRPVEVERITSLAYCKSISWIPWDGTSERAGDHFDSPSYRLPSDGITSNGVPVLAVGGRGITIDLILRNNIDRPGLPSLISKERLGIGEAMGDDCYERGPVFLSRDAFTAPFPALLGSESRAWDATGTNV